MGLVGEKRAGWPGEVAVLVCREPATWEEMAGALVAKETMEGMAEAPGDWLAAVVLVEAPGALAMLAVTGGWLEWEIPWDFREGTDRGWQGCLVGRRSWVERPIWRRLLGVNYPGSSLTSSGRGNVPSGWLHLMIRNLEK